MFHFPYAETIEDIMDDLRDEVSGFNFSTCKQDLHHWDTSKAGRIVWLDPKNNPKVLILFLTDPLKMVKYDPVFAFKNKKFCTSLKGKG